MVQRFFSDLLHGLQRTCGPVAWTGRRRWSRRDPALSRADEIYENVVPCLGG